MILKFSDVERSIFELWAKLFRHICEDCIRLAREKISGEKKRKNLLVWKNFSGFRAETFRHIVKSVIYLSRVHLVWKVFSNVNVLTHNWQITSEIYAY